MFKFIEEHRSAFAIELMCRVMNVSARGLWAFRNRPASRRQRSDMVTLAHIKEQSRFSLCNYGRPRMTEELKGIGLDIGHRRVGRLMRQNGILKHLAFNLIHSLLRKSSSSILVV